MNNYPDLTAQEKKAAQRATRKLRREFKNILSTLTIKQGSQLFKKTGVFLKMKFDSLDHLAVVAPHYIFKQHYGFEGIKKTE